MSIASRTGEQPGERTSLPRDDAWIVAALEQHSASMLGLARRYSLCADDAQEACQRTAEIFLRRAAHVTPATVGGWLRTVARNEALAVRAQRVALVGEGEFEEALTPPVEDATERVERLEHLGRAAEAFERLKPQEVRALVLLAEGHSYKEISAITGWSYTKVNRCVTEGRRAFRDRVTAIETGEECERWAPSLSALADGEASMRQVVTLRPHLRRCPACRATLRAYREAPAQVAVLAGPVALLLPAAVGATGLLSRLHDALATGVHERIPLSVQKAQALMETASTGKLAAVAASTVALAGGGLVAGQRLVAPVHHRHSHVVAAKVARAPVASPRPAAKAGGAGTTVSAPARATPARAVEPPAARRARVSSAEFTPEGGAAGSPGRPGGATRRGARRVRTAKAASVRTAFVSSAAPGRSSAAPRATSPAPAGEFAP